MVNQKIETAALKMDFVYVSKKVWWYSFNDTGSGLPSGTCIGVLQQECCSANSFNGLPEEKGVKKDWCEVQGCESSCLNVTRRLDQVDASHDVHHLRSSRIMQNKRSMIEGDFAGTDFNDVLGEYTTLDPLSTGAVLGPSNLEHDAECRANSYYAIDHNSPTLICEDYESNRCDANDYMIKKENETFCLNVRAVDPSNDLEEDTIIRTTAPYNIPYTLPSEEELTRGTVYLSLVTENITNLTFNDQLELEEITLEWIKDNVGSSDTFSP
ncbi:hypothetical protein ACHAWO_012447, partial [Cyclotella atomus]